MQNDRINTVEIKVEEVSDKISYKDGNIQIVTKWQTRFPSGSSRNGMTRQEKRQLFRVHLNMGIGCVVRHVTEAKREREAE